MDEYERDGVCPFCHCWATIILTQNPLFKSELYFWMCEICFDDFYIMSGEE